MKKKATLLGMSLIPVLLYAEPLQKALGPNAVVPLPLQMREVDSKAPLEGLNFVADGTRTIVTGVNGDGFSLLAPETEPAIITPAATATAAAADSADGRKLWQALEQIPLHGSGVVEFPKARYKVSHDNNYDYGADGKTWVGYVNDDPDRRVIVTAGEGVLNGTIITPSGRYSLVGERLIDLKTLQARPIDKHPAMASAPRGLAPVAADTTAAATKATTVIDLLAYFDRKVGGGAPRIRIRHLVALANQAFVDSGINARIRIVGLRPLPWVSQASGRAMSNDTVLTKISDLVATDATYSNLKATTGADLVMVVRPNRLNLTDCGVGYIGGAWGAPFSSDTGLSVVVEGVDEFGISTCDDYALAHEIGHNLGSAHDQPNANDYGHFLYSFGNTGTDRLGGQWYTIMAYPQSENALITPKFSSPNLTCTAVPGGEVACGNSSANNARSIRQSVSTVAGYVPATR